MEGGRKRDVRRGEGGRFKERKGKGDGVWRKKEGGKVEERRKGEGRLWTSRTAK